MNLYDNNMYTYPFYTQRTTMNIDEELITQEQALQLIKQSVMNEKEDELFYDMLIKQSSTQDEKTIIEEIRNDERKHNQILKKIYKDLTGQVLNNDNTVVLEHQNLNYEQQLKQALLGEIAAVKKYRKIMSAMMDGEHYALMMSIMTDELRHASLYNYLIHIVSKGS